MRSTGWLAPGDRIWIVNGHGQVIGHSFHAAGTTLAAVHGAVANATAAGMSTATVPTASGGAAIVVHSDAQTRSALSALRRTLVFALLAGIVLAAVAGMVLASRALRPVDRMREEVDEIPGQDLDRRLRVGRNDELGRLARAFNRLLARVEAASRVQEQFIADASHELKTPITAIEGHARIVLRAIDRGDSTLARESADVVARQSHRIALTLRELLELAQTGEASPPTEPVRLDVVVQDATDEAQALAPDRSIRASVVPATVLGDPDRLRELVSVLVDNALKYSPPERPVEIAVSTSNGRGPVLRSATTGPDCPKPNSTPSLRASRAGPPPPACPAVASGCRSHGRSPIATAPPSRCRPPSAVARSPKSGSRPPGRPGRSSATAPAKSQGPRVTLAARALTSAAPNPIGRPRCWPRPSPKPSLE